MRWGDEEMDEREGAKGGFICVYTCLPLLFSGFLDPEGVTHWIAGW